MNLDNLKLRSITFDKQDDVTIIGRSTDNIYSFKDSEDIIINIAKYLDGNHKLKDIVYNIQHDGFDLSLQDVQEIIMDVFLKNDLLLENSDSILLSDKEMLKYDRIIHFFDNYMNVGYLTAQTKLKQLFNAHVLIFGVGGTGGHTAHALIASGVRNITLVDFDNVEITNVTRQMLYDEDNIGRPKIEVAKERLLKINPDANINIFNKQVTDKSDILNIISEIDKVDFVVNTMDNPRGLIRYILDEALYDLNVPYIYNGSAGSSVFVGPTVKKGITKSYQKLIPQNKHLPVLIQNINEDIYITNVIEPMNGSVGQLTAFEVIKYLTHCAELSTWGTRVRLNLDTLEIDKYEL